MNMPDLTQMTAAQIFSSAVAAHQAGDRERAEALYKRVLQANPKDDQAQYLLGALFYEQRKLDQSCDYLEIALKLNPGHAAARAMLGASYSILGHSEKALIQFEAVATAQPQSDTAQYNYARGLFDAKRYGDAAAVFKKALLIRPNRIDCILGHALCQHALGDLQAAIKVVRECVSAFPENLDARATLARFLLEFGEEAEASLILEACLTSPTFNRLATFLLGQLRYRQLRLAEAEQIFRRGVAFAPKDVGMNNYLGAVLHNLGQLPEAEVWVRKAYALDSKDPEVLANMGLILNANGHISEAIEFHQSALALRPSMPETWNNLGVSLQALGRWDEALASYDHALSLKPGFHGAITNKGHTLLTLGRLQEGWGAYRHRFDQKILATKRRIFSYPQWTGMADVNTTLLLWTDQGLGDEVLYSSMINDASARVGRCVIECSHRLVDLFQRSFPQCVVLPRTNPADPRIEIQHPHFQISLAELGEILRPSLASIPQHQGYLKAAPRFQQTLREKYERLAGGRKIVGVSWKSENARTGVFKSVPLQNWVPIFQAASVFLVSLQYGNVVADISDMHKDFGIDIYHDVDIDPVQNPDMSAAQITAMDLVLTTSNTTAHFAGALNVPVWTLVPSGSGSLWYWFSDRSDSPWYPSMRIYRQSSERSWSRPIAQVATDIAAWAIT